jgi:hypothetical protein
MKYAISQKNIRQSQKRRGDAELGSHKVPFGFYKVEYTAEMAVLSSVLTYNTNRE